MTTADSIWRTSDATCLFPPSLWCSLNGPDASPGRKEEEKWMKIWQNTSGDWKYISLFLECSVRPWFSDVNWFLADSLYRLLEICLEDLYFYMYNKWPYKTSLYIVLCLCTQWVDFVPFEVSAKNWQQRMPLPVRNSVVCSIALIFCSCCSSRVPSWWAAQYCTMSKISNSNSEPAAQLLHVASSKPLKVNTRQLSQGPHILDSILPCGRFHGQVSHQVSGVDVHSHYHSTPVVFHPHPDHPKANFSTVACGPGIKVPGPMAQRHW